MNDGVPFALTQDNNRAPVILAVTHLFFTPHALNIYFFSPVVQTLEKRRKKLYELHRKYQRRTCVAPSVNAAPSGIIPLPPQLRTESEGVAEEDEGSEGEDFLSPEFGGRIPRAVRGDEPPVAGWAAAGVAAGVIDGVRAECFVYRNEFSDGKTTRRPFSFECFRSQNIFYKSQYDSVCLFFICSV